MTEVKPFTYEWFKSLTDEQLTDIAMLEATWGGEGSHLQGDPYSEQQRDLIAALAHRIRIKEEPNATRTEV